MNILCSDIPIYWALPVSGSSFSAFAPLQTYLESKLSSSLSQLMQLPSFPDLLCMHLLGHSHFSGVRKGDNSDSEAKVEECFSDKKIQPHPNLPLLSTMSWWGVSTLSAWTFTLHHLLRIYLLRAHLRRESASSFS